MLQAVILGIVQGLGEFLPISSSAHLVLVPWFMGWQYHGLTFDVALHVGTLIAVVAFFWKDWFVLISHGLRIKSTVEGRLFWYLVVATIPGAAFGYFLEEYAETIFREPLLIGILLILMGVILYAVDALALKQREMGDMHLRDSILIGLSQALAILPGVSRSGVTISMGRMLGLTRDAAARFSFLLSTPIIFGAGLMRLKDLSPGQVDVSFVTGMVVSAVVGFLSIKFLLQYVSKHSYAVFAGYRFLIGGAVIIIVFLRG